MVVDALHEVGAARSIVIDENGVILAGNGVVEAAGEAGIERVRVVDADGEEIIAVRRSNLTEKQKARLAKFDNRTAELAEWDIEQLAADLADGEDLSGIFTDDELAALLQDMQTTAEPLADPDDVPETPAEPITKRGDVILLGKHRLMCGDCRDFETVERLVDGTRINVAITSPPYASQRKYDESSEFKPIAPDAYIDWYRDVAANIMAVLADDGSYFCNIKEHCDDGQRHLYVKKLTIAHVEEWGWRFVDEFCWRDKKNGVPGGWPNRFKDAWEPVFHFCTGSEIKFHPLANGTESDGVFDYSSSSTKAKTGSGLLGQKAEGVKSGIARPSNVLEIAATSAGGHSAPYPVALPTFFIRAFSDRQDAIYDPFMGSGTTLIAAEQEGRIAYGCEISPAYCDVIVERWQNLTGKTAQRHDSQDSIVGHGLEATLLR